MVRIVSESDIALISESNELCPFSKDYIERHCKMILRYGTFKELGGVYILETADDLADHLSIGLSRPICDSTPESVTLILGRRGNREPLYHVCFVLNNSGAIDIFAHPDALDLQTDEMFKSEIASTVYHRIMDNKE